MGILIVYLCAAAYTLPLYITHRRKIKEPKSYYRFAFFMGILAAVFSVIFRYLLIDLGLWSDEVPPHTFMGGITVFLKILFEVALVEEFFKFLCGTIVLHTAVKKHPDLTESGSMLIFAFVGLAFEILESFTSFRIIDGLFRGLTPLHFFFQLWMGKWWWKAHTAKEAGARKNTVKFTFIALSFPLLVHTLFDFLVNSFITGLDPTGALEDLIMWPAGILAWIAIIFILITYIRAAKKDTADLSEEK